MKYSSQFVHTLYLERHQHTRTWRSVFFPMEVHPTVPSIHTRSQGRISTGRVFKHEPQSMVWTKTRPIPAHHQETGVGGWWFSSTAANRRGVDPDWFTGHSSSARCCRGLGLSTLPRISARCCPSMVSDTKTSGPSILQWGGNGEGNSRSPHFSGSPEMARGSLLATSHRRQRRHSRESSKWS